MSLVPVIQNPVIYSLTTTNNKKWIPNSETTEIKSTQIYNVYSAIRKQTYDDDGATDDDSFGITRKQRRMYNKACENILTSDTRVQ